MVPVTDYLPKSLGFRDGTAGVHTSRTIMLKELALVLDALPPAATASAYTAAIVEQNLLGKPTRTTRKRTAKRLCELYGLDPHCPLFRLLRHFWIADHAARPMLACLAAAARDPLLREAMPFVLAVPVGETVTPEAIREYLSAAYPNRFRESTSTATAQRLASSWSQSGYLAGKVVKKRSRPSATPSATGFALLLAYLCGQRGGLLLESPWAKMLACTPAELATLVREASKQGWLNFKSVGSVIEITFPGLLSAKEEVLTHVSDRTP